MAEKQCKAIRSMEAVFSKPQKVVLYIMLGGVYNCPIHKTQHQLPKEWESESNEVVET